MTNPVLPILDLLEVFYSEIIKSENCDLVKESHFVSIRNGRSEVVDEHIRLEVDKFGKITAEEMVKPIYIIKSIETIPFNQK